MGSKAERAQRTVVFGAVIITALVCSFQMPSRVRAQAGCDADPPLCDLIDRLLAPSLSTSADATPELLPLSLPPDSPVEIPLPDGGRVIGSVVYRHGDQLVRFSSVIDAPGDVSAAVAFYDRQLTAQGLSHSSIEFGLTGGFEPTQPGLPHTYCVSSSGPEVTISARPLSSGVTDVRFSVDTGGRTACSFPGPESGLSLIPAPLPILIAPAGVMVSLNGGGGGSVVEISDTAAPPPRHSVSDAIATTDMSASDLETAFRQQLVDAGWMLTANGTDGPLAWSTYTVPSMAGSEGFLYVLQGTDPGQYLLHVELNAPP